MKIKTYSVTFQGYLKVIALFRVSGGNHIS